MDTDFTDEMSFHLVRTYGDGRQLAIHQSVGNSEYLQDVFSAYAEFLNAVGFSYLSFDPEQTEAGWLIPFDKN